MSTRCREGLSKASLALRSAAEAVATTFGDELVALELRLALEELGKVVGAVYTDDILDRVFSRFCIGK
jgi:tRNA modification GTPase